MAKMPAVATTAARAVRRALAPERPASLLAARGRAVPEASALFAAVPLTRADGMTVVVAATTVVDSVDAEEAGEDCAAGTAATTTTPDGARVAEADAEGEQPQTVRVMVTTTGPLPNGRFAALPVALAGREEVGGVPLGAGVVAGAAMTVTPPPFDADRVEVAGTAVTVLRGEPVEDACVLEEVGASPMMASVPSVMVVTGASLEDDCARARPAKAAAKRLENCMMSGCSRLRVTKRGFTDRSAGEKRECVMWLVKESD